MDITETDWNWLTSSLKEFLASIDHPKLFERLTIRDEWSLLEAKSPGDKKAATKKSMSVFRKEIWEKELGKAA